MSTGDIFENLVFPKGGPNKTALVQRDGYSVMRISLGKGAKIPPHVANHSAFFLVLKGRAIITSGDEDVELGENEFVAMEANQMRGIQALEDSVILGVRD
ncbi:MAG: cupin domain-containing protein [Candidatus Thorarchaeota archaeon]|nr:cupin domain-containing protein [Candidatus Thorarchaeota archaeon]MCK5238467.1 cupin domain-containing protein [Candidatus Thorarchaeota archaeon]